MNLTDKTEIKGHFNIKTYKTDGSVDEYSDDNLIMNDARRNMAKLIGGWVGKPINKIVLGTAGHDNNNILTPILPETGEFTSNRDMLISEELNEFSYFIKWGDLSYVGENDGASASIFSIDSTDSKQNSIKVTINDKVVTFEITIEENSANNTGIVAYTEAALYAGEKIFSMKTFPAKVKEDSVKMVITWSLIF